MSRKLALLCILVCCGCAASTSIAPVHEPSVPSGKVEFGGDSVDGQPGIDFGSIHYEGKRVIVWSDGRGGVPAYSDGNVKAKIESRRPGSTECDFEVPVSGKGNAIIDGKTYKMADGNVFLISLDGLPTRVLQLDRELETVQLESNSDNGSALKLAMKDDSDFLAFFHGPVAAIIEGK